MNKFLMEELNKTKINLPPYGDSTVYMLIPKSNRLTLKIDEIKIGDVYNIYVEDYVVHPNESFNLAENWNHGTKPSENRLRAQIVAINGKMVFMHTQSLSSKEIWDGWIPRKSFTVLEG